MKSIVLHISLILSAFYGIDGTKKLTCDPNQCEENWHLCDGVKDCKDGCDESAELCKLTKGCTLPDTTDDKSYVVNCDENVTPNPGEYAPEMSLLSFTCKPGYTRYNADEIFRSLCFNGSWTPEIPSCVIKPNGSVKDIECVPLECGRFSKEAELLYHNNYLPWDVLVHSVHNATWSNTSGTLIAPDLVLTVSDRKLVSYDYFSPEDTVVIVNGYLDQADRKSYKVKKIFVPEKKNLAILQLEDKVEISATVQPVCIDWNNDIVPPEESKTMGLVIVSKESSSQRDGAYIGDINTYPTNKCRQVTTLSEDQFCGENTDRWRRPTSLDWGTGHFVQNQRGDTFYIKGVLRPVSSVILVFTNVTTYMDWIRTIVEENYNIDDLSLKNCKRTANHYFQQDLDYISQPPLYYGSWRFRCYMGELQIESTGACYIPPNNRAYTTYKFQCPFTTSHELKESCNNTSEGVLVPEYSVLTTRCKEGYVPISENVEKSFCVGGQWVPKFPPDTNKKLCRKSQVESLECRYQGEVIDCGDELMVKYST